MLGVASSLVAVPASAQRVGFTITATRQMQTAVRTWYNQHGSHILTVLAKDDEVIAFNSTDGEDEIMLLDDACITLGANATTALRSVLPDPKIEVHWSAFLQDDQYGADNCMYAIGHVDPPDFSGANSDFAAATTQLAVVRRQITTLEKS